MSKKIKDSIIDTYYKKVFEPYIKEHGIENLRERLYFGITPVGYHSLNYRIQKALSGETVEPNILRDAIWAEYLQIPKNKRRINYATEIVDSNYKPTINNENIEKFRALDLDNYEKQNIINNAPLKYNENKVSHVLGVYFNAHTIGRGFDDKGEYISYYDEWDVAPIGKDHNQKDQSKGIGKPIYFYDRIYLDDFYNIPEKDRGNPYITPATIIAENKSNYDKKEYGGMMKQKRIAPNVICGGVAIPLKSNYFLMKGRTHREGGIDVGKDLEVEDGEVMKITKNNIKVLSAKPILNGTSPAEYATKGNIRKRFEQAFRAQERFKRINGLNDNGTKKAKYGINKKLIDGDESNFNIKLGELPGALYEVNVKEKSLYDKAFPNIPLRPVRENKYTKQPLGFYNIDEDIKNGQDYLYNNVHNDIYYKDNDGKYYIHKNYYNHETGNINSEEFTKVSYNEIRKLLPKRDYIGGSKKDVGIKVINKIPKLKETILNLSKQYGISSDLFTQRLINEGWLQNIAMDYNNSTAKNQETFAWGDYMDNEISGYQQLGLDTFGNHLDAGHLNLKRNINFTDTYQINEDGTGHVYKSANFLNAYDALEAKAAMLEYFTNIAKKRNISKEDMNAYVNAMYNMGEGNDDLNNMDYVRKQYSVDKYFKLGGKINIKNNFSTGKRTKAELGEVMKVDKNGQLIDDIKPAVITARKPLNEIVQSELVRRILLDKIKLFDDEKIPTYKINTKLDTKDNIRKKAELGIIKIKKDIKKPATLLTKSELDKLRSRNISSSKLPKVKKSSKIITESTLKSSTTPRPTKTNLSISNTNKLKSIATSTKAITNTNTGLAKPKRDIGKRIDEIDSSKLLDTKSSGLAIPKGYYKDEKGNIKRSINPLTPTTSNKETKSSNTIIDNQDNDSDIILDTKSDVKGNNKKDKVSYLQANPTFLPNLISTGINIIGSGISYGINKKFLNELKAPKAPYLLQPTKLKTIINIKPQVNELKRTINRYNKYFDQNTASSQTAVGRRLLNEQTYIDNYNQLYGAKENQETQLINQDRLQQHETTKYNLTNYNNWLREKINFENSVREKKSENAQMITQNIAGSFTNFLDKQAQWKESMANIAALSAAYPDVTPEYMAEQGLPYALWLKEKRERRNNS